MPAEILERYPDGTFKVRRKRSQKVMFGYELQINGKKFRPSNFPTLELARKARAAKKLEPLLESHGLLPTAPVTLGELINAWLVDAEEREMSITRRTLSKFVLNTFKDQFRSDPLLKDITAQDLRTFKANRVEEALHQHTLILYLSIIRAVFNSAEKLFPKLKWKPPVINMPSALYQSREVIYSPDEINLLLEDLHGPPRNKLYERPHLLARDYSVIALHTARRESEILGLVKSQVDFTPGVDSEYGRINFNLAKKKMNSGPRQSSKRRTIPMTLAVAKIIRERFDSTRSDRLFGDDTIKALAACLRRGFKAACERVGISYGYENDGGVIHTLRHSAATYLSSLNLPLPVIMAILGHESFAMSFKYTHPTPEGMGDAIKALSQFGVRKISAEMLDEPDQSNMLKETEKANTAKP